MKNSFVKIFVFLALALSGSAHVFGQEVGKLTCIQGRVDTFTQNSQIALAARDLDKISVGDSVRTKSDARAEISLRDGSIVRLAPNSRVTIVEYALDNKDQRQSAKVKLERGKMRTIIAKMHSLAPFDILTPNAQGTIKGSDIFTSFEAGTSAILVKEGTLTITNTLQPQTPLVVNAGSSIMIPMQNPPQGPRPYMEMEQKLFEQETNVIPAPKKLEASMVTATIAQFQGSVLITLKGANKTHPAAIQETIKEGDSIETGENSTAKIQLDNRNELNLKPKTKLSVIRLSLNTATGEYENLFEITIGTVKARIEGLKGNSKFEVKTPTAICGARGTIIYVSVLPNGFTTLAVEGGLGYIANPLSGNSQDVSGGTQSSSDNQGNISNPQPLTEEQRGSLDEGLSGGGNTEGSSSGSGGTNGFSWNSDSNGAGAPGSGTDTTQGSPDTAGDTSTVNIPITETASTDTDTPPTTESVVIADDLSGQIGRYSADSESNHHINSIGDITGVQLTKNTTSNTIIETTTLTGHYSQESESNKHLWFVDLNSTDDNGIVYYGTTGGTKIGNDLDGLAIALYIKPDGSTGLIQSFDLSGNFDPDSLTLHAQGTIYSVPFFNLNGLKYEISNNSNIHGEVGNGNFSGYINVQTTEIRTNDFSWGIWQATCGGSDERASASDPLTAVVGGIDNSNDDNSYWLGHITADEGPNGKLKGHILDGITLSDESIGYFGGDLVGFVDGESWESIVTGVHTEVPLSFASEITYPRYTPSIVYSVSVPTTSLSGILGSEYSLWSNNPVPFKFMGTYSASDPNAYSLWGADLISHNYSNGTDTTYDGGAYYGMIGGIFKDTMNGKLIALYIDNDHNAGILSGDFTGDMYSDLGMFKANGHMQATFKVDGVMIAPKDLQISLNESELNGAGSGSFSTGGVINGSITTADSSIFSINIPNQPLAWGIWGTTIKGDYNNMPADSHSWRLGLGGEIFDVPKTSGLTSTDTPEPASCWMGTLSGSDWQNNKANDEFKGIVISPSDEGKFGVDVFSGNAARTYTEVGEQPTWQADAIGEWTEVSKSFDPEQVGYNWQDLKNFVSVPVSEVYSKTLTASAANVTGHITEATMDISLYSSTASSLGLWAALINGKYSTAITPTDWSATLTNGSGNNVLLTGTGAGWANGQWTASVSGTVGGNTIDHGQASGTFDSGNFQGAGTGTWQQTPPSTVGQ